MARIVVQVVVCIDFKIIPKTVVVVIDIEPIKDGIVVVIEVDGVVKEVTIGVTIDIVLVEIGSQFIGEVRFRSVVRIPLPDTCC